jgi:hypothetical protein
VQYLVGIKENLECNDDILNRLLFVWQVAAEVAAPLSQVKKITMVSDGTGEIGAGRITGEVTDRQCKFVFVVFSCSFSTSSEVE